MFNNTVATEPTELDLAIARVFLEMKQTQPDSDEFEKMVDLLVKFETLKAAERPQKMSIDTKATLIANLAGIAAILYHEKSGVVATKALGLVAKAFR
jgi:hypothetical protein